MTEVVMHFDSVGVEVPPPAPKLLEIVMLGKGEEEMVAEKQLKLDEARGVTE